MRNQNDLPRDGRAIGVRIDCLNRKLEALAMNGEWAELPHVIKDRDDLLSRAPDLEQAALLQAAVCSNDKILKMAQSERQSVANQLTSLRHSREKSGRYESQRNA